MRDEPNAVGGSVESRRWSPKELSRLDIMDSDSESLLPPALFSFCATWKDVDRLREPESFKRA
jgi:hypothetical protein